MQSRKNLSQCKNNLHQVVAQTTKQISLIEAKQLSFKPNLYCGIVFIQPNNSFNNNKQFVYLCVNHSSGGMFW